MGSGKFWIGMVAGMVAGVLVYHCACSKRAKRIRAELCERIRNMGGKTGDYLDEMRDKAIDTGVKVADKVAEKAEEARDRAHNIAQSLKG
ncbi:MAG: YtxH domain-containing protein [Bacteroidaceae bacterium]|nr:YtxH domain-containing protein [Bacteroidaceae bacterium]